MNSQRKERGVRRNHHRISVRTFYGEVGNSKCVIAVSAAVELRGTPRFGDAPRDLFMPRNLLLNANHSLQAFVEDRAPIMLHPQGRHQILEHSAGPGKEHPPTPDDGM